MEKLRVSAFDECYVVDPEIVGSVFATDAEFEEADATGIEGDGRAGFVELVEVFPASAVALPGFGELDDFAMGVVAIGFAEASVLFVLHVDHLEADFDDTWALGPKLDARVLGGVVASG